MLEFNSRDIENVKAICKRHYMYLKNFKKAYNRPVNPQDEPRS